MSNKLDGELYLIRPAKARRNYGFPSQLPSSSESLMESETTKELTLSRYSVGHLPPSYDQFLILKIRERLIEAGIPTDGFSCHSIQKGAAVTAAANGISINQITSANCFT